MRPGGLVWMSPPHVHTGTEYAPIVCYIAFLARMRFAYVAVAAPLKSPLFQAQQFAESVTDTLWRARHRGSQRKSTLALRCVDVCCRPQCATAAKC
eukprot:4157895-Pyramimonas_sp.AAC.1